MWLIGGVGCLGKVPVVGVSCVIVSLGKVGVLCLMMSLGEIPVAVVGVAS
jgi:hypothetical protein